MRREVLCNAPRAACSIQDRTPGGQPQQLRHPLASSKGGQAVVVRGQKPKVVEDRHLQYCSRVTVGASSAGAGDASPNPCATRPCEFTPPLPPASEDRKHPPQ